MNDIALNPTIMCYRKQADGSVIYLPLFHPIDITPLLPGATAQSSALSLSSSDSNPPLDGSVHGSIPALTSSIAQDNPISTSYPNPNPNP
ncbi:hypothetical protein EON65_50715, partial [archaeon]